MDGQDDIWGTAARFRRALEQGGLHAPGLKRFPRGSCGDASELLGQYFQDCGLGLWTYATGRALGGATHAWIQRQGVLVDITADQFGDVSETVIVSTSSYWHRSRWARFGGEHVAGLAYYGSDVRSNPYREDYVTLKARADREI